MPETCPECDAEDTTLMDKYRSYIDAINFNIVSHWKCLSCEYAFSTSEAEE